MILQEEERVRIVIYSIITWVILLFPTITFLLTVESNELLHTKLTCAYKFSQSSCLTYNVMHRTADMNISWIGVIVHSQLTKFTLIQDCFKRTLELCESPQKIGLTNGHDSWRKYFKNYFMKLAVSSTSNLSTNSPFQTFNIPYFICSWHFAWIQSVLMRKQVVKKLHKIFLALFLEPSSYCCP
jgi:hypothetical protein